MGILREQREDVGEGGRFVEAALVDEAGGDVGGDNRFFVDVGKTGEIALSSRSSGGQ